VNAKALQPTADIRNGSVKSINKAMRARNPRTNKRKRDLAPAVLPAAEQPASSVVLASSCAVKDAAVLKQSLCQHLQAEAEVAIDVGSVERIDTSTMQLLCAFVRDRAARHAKVEWIGDSRALREAVRLLGVEAMLALPSMETTR
jgi:ABC-type transporter Mla MlaB component